MELLVKINKKLEQRRAILNTIIQNVGIQNKILKSAQILAECLKLGGKIITAGNGGSASQSEHFSSEMMGRLKNSRTPFPSLSLSSNASLLTCIGNDFGFERIFSRQIEGIGTTKDVFLAFTTSCKSRNIIEALNVCKNSNIKSIVFTGQCVHDIDLLAEEIIRYAISMMLQIPMSKKAIAEAIGVDKSTVYREIKRNCDARSGSYSMELAQRKADRRKQQKHRKEVLTPAMRKRIIKLLKKGFSPEQIVGRSRLEGIAMVSHETIYRWIWEDKRRGGKLHKYLRRQGRRYAKRGSKNAGRGFIPGRVDIDERPEIVELKERFGDLEIDTIIGKNHKGAILTINDRATSRVWIRKLSGKEAIPVAKIAVWALRKVKNLIHTITADNGKEFAKHEEIAQKLEIKFYFCKPYHSWERGANENTNGLIRQYIPKGKDFSEVTNKQIKWIENKLNNRPRKRLGYLTPNEKFKQIINQNSVAFAS